MKIYKLLTPYNYTDGEISRVKYLVIHYVGATGGAEANCRYYASKYIGASAHYYVGFDGEVWQSVEDKNIAWHCGAKSYRHKECRNSNSIGIELCVRNKGSQAATSKDWYFEKATVDAAVSLVKKLMERYQIPIDHVVRHYDVTGKICPNPFVYNETEFTWDQFKEAAAREPAGWVKDEKGWWYRREDGSYPKDQWEKIDDKWYWFDGAGYAVKDAWKKTGGKWYYLGPDYSMVTGLWTIKEKVYYFYENGVMATEPVTLIPDQEGALH